MKPIHFLSQILFGYIIGVTTVYACEQIPFVACQNVLPYSTTTYPNYMGHTSSADSVASFTDNFGIYQVLGCHELLVYFVCTLVAPKCDIYTGMIVPPCQELCYTVRGPCLGVPVDVQCSDYPTMAENPNCISIAMAETVTTPPPTVSITSIFTELWTNRRTTRLSTEQTSPVPTQILRSSITPTVTHGPRIISPSSETSENTVTYRTPDGDGEINNETLDIEKNYQLSSTIILGVSIGTLVTMVTLVTMCVCCRFYTQWKSPNARARPVPEAYGGFYANPAFENTNGNDCFTQHPANGPNQGGAVVNSSQTNTQIAAELAITQLPPHPASRPLRTLPVCMPGPPGPQTNGTSNLDHTTSSSDKSVPSNQYPYQPSNANQYPYQPSQRRNTLPANASPGSARRSDPQTKIPDTARDVPLSLKAGTLPPEKVLENTGPRPYQEGSVPHYCTLNRNFASSKKSPKRFSRTSFLWRRDSSKGGDAPKLASSPEGTPTRFQDPSQDLVFANPAAKDEDCNKNGGMIEINLNEETSPRIDQNKDEIDNRHYGDNTAGHNKGKMVDHGSPVIANMSNNKQ